MNMERRTKRRYAHELYPHAMEGEIRPLEVEVPYLYSRAVGLGTWGSGWVDLDVKVPANARLVADRVNDLVQARALALLADAVHQGLTGDEAWRWAAERMDEDGELTYDRATHYGVPFYDIKPYPCGPEPEEHEHLAEPDAQGGRTISFVKGRESACPDCTEPVS